MSDLGLAAVIVGLTLVTLVSRSLFLVLGDRVPLPSRIQHGLRYAPACALAALIMPQLVLADQTLQLTLGNPRLDAALVAVLVMRFSRNMLAAMFTGMGAFLLLRALL